MLVGVVERRLARRIPFQVELTIHFMRDGMETAQATATDISAGGIQFYLPWGVTFAQPGEVAEFLFDLPFRGKTSLMGEIRHLRLGMDLDQNRIVYYGAKFTNLSIDLWTSLLDFCHAKAEEIEAELAKEEKVKPVIKDRLDYRVPARAAEASIRMNHGREHHGTLEDISFGGAKIRVSKEIPVDSEVEFSLVGKGSPLKLKARCVWVVPTGDGDGYWVGVRFENIGKEEFERLREIVFGLVS